MATKAEGVIEGSEAPAKPVKEKLTPEQRATQVREKRQARLDEAFKGQKFEYIGPISLDADKRYIDVTGNKGRHGFKIRNTKTGDEIIVGPGSLKYAQEVGAITVPPKPKKEKAPAADASEGDVAPADA